MSSKIEQLRAWLTTTNQFFESINLKKDQRRLSYADYLQFRKELESKTLDNQPVLLASLYDLSSEVYAFQSKPCWGPRLPA